MGPVILLTLGVQFLLDSMGVIRFGRTLPVLLVVIGLVKIFQSTGRPRTAAPALRQAPGTPFSGTSGEVPPPCIRGQVGGKKWLARCRPRRPSSRQEPAGPRRSVAGPVVMILLGVVLLLTTMHVLQPQPFLRWFGTYWPALIILWGVIKLVEYQRLRREGLRPTGIGAGGVCADFFNPLRIVGNTSFPLQLG